MSVVIDGTGEITGLTSGAGIAAAALSGQVPDANAPSGSLLQRQHTTFRDQVIVSTTSFADVFTTTFTPKRADSKIYLYVNLHWGRRDIGDLQFAHHFLRNSSEITEKLTATGTAYDVFRAQVSDTANGHAHTLLMGYDTPNTTSAITYKFQLLKPNAGYANVYVNFNGNTGSSVFVIEEIAS